MEAAVANTAPVTAVIVMRTLVRRQDVGRVVLEGLNRGYSLCNRGRGVGEAYGMTGRLPSRGNLVLKDMVSER